MTFNFDLSVDYYKILNCEYGDDIKKLRKNFNILVKIFHPDVYEGDSEIFLIIRKAWDILSNDDSRDYYNKNSPLFNKSEYTLESIVKELGFDFNTNINPKRNKFNNKKDILINISKEDLERGYIRYKRKMLCNNCDCGYNESKMLCDCKGYKEDCVSCNGSGIKKIRCMKCNGACIYIGVQQIKLTKYISHVISNMGHYYNGKFGRLYLKFK